MLLQEQIDKTEKPVGYWPTSLTKAEKAYDTTQRDCLAIVWSILLLRPYLEGCRLTIRTDHDSLRWILNLTGATGRLARWQLCLSEFDSDVIHRAGVIHQAADALPRLPTGGTDKTTLENERPIAYINIVQNHEDDQPSHVLEDFSSTIMHLIPDQKPLEAHTLTDFIKAQGEDAFCQQAAKQIGERGTEFSLNKHGIIIR